MRYWCVASLVVAAVRSCKQSAVIDNYLIQLALWTERSHWIVRARFTDIENESAAQRCLDAPGQKNRGIRWKIIMKPTSVVEGEDICRLGSVFNLWGSQVPETSPSNLDDCTPKIYSETPFLCATGDLSGHFGPLNLGIADDSKEELRFHYDNIPYSRCSLNGTYLGVFCADGSVAGCTPLKIEPVIDSEVDILKFIVKNPPLPVVSCGKYQSSISDLKSTLVDPMQRYFQDRISGKMPNWSEDEKFANLWGDIKQRSRSIWDLMRNR